MKSKILPWAIVGVLVVVLFWLLSVDSGEPIVVEKHTTDTLTIIKHDTTVITKVKIEKAPADTVYITVRDTVTVPIVRQEYTFSEPNMFDFRVKGYMVDFLDATVYPKTVYETIYEQNTTTITKYRSSLFVFGGFSSICGDFSPKVGVGLSLKGKWLISADLGLYQKTPIYSTTVGYNVLQK